MKMFIWNYANRLTENYHDGGGLAVVASSLERARELVPIESNSRTNEPDQVYILAEQAEEKVFIFPDAGCC